MPGYRRLELTMLVPSRTDTTIAQPIIGMHTFEEFGVQKACRKSDLVEIVAPFFSRETYH
jgi:hypothetical protein